MLRAFLLVGIGGAVGSMLRYGIGFLINKNFSHSFPLATFIINITGCFLIGLLFGYGQKNHLMPADWWLILGTGFCGGFTTFSAFALENHQLVQAQQSLEAITYTLLSVGVGILLCRTGIWLMAIDQ